MESILNSIKSMIGINEEDTSFDLDIIIHINSVFSILRQLGVGPETTFGILDDKPVWDDFLDDNVDFNEVKTYMYLKTKLVFDPPASSTVIKAMEDNIKEYEWRLAASASNKAMEETDEDE